MHATRPSELSAPLQKSLEMKSYLGKPELAGKVSDSPLHVKWAEATEHYGCGKTDSGSPSNSGCAEIHSLSVSLKVRCPPLVILSFIKSCGFSLFLNVWASR
jgi:hypothetical protein